MKINSIRFKASVLFSVILCVILLANSVLIYFGLHRILYRDLDRALLIKAQQISSILNAYAQARQADKHPFAFINNFLSNRPNDSAIIEELWDADVKSLGLKDDYFRIIDLQGRVRLSSSNLDKPIASVFEALSPDPLNRVNYQAVHDKVISGRLISYPFLYQKNMLLVVQLVTPTRALTGILNNLVVFMLLSIVLIVFLTGSLGGYLTKSILKPISSVTATANKISHTDLSVRIDEQEIDWEMKELIRSFNSMISRLEASFAHINEFSSHVAHELKTPLAIIRGEVELSLSEEDADKETYRQTLEGALEETDHLIRIIKDLLLLAKLDYRPEIFKFEKVNFCVFFKDLVSQSELLAHEKEIKIDLELPNEEMMIEADPVHLRRLFFNLINNAIKFSPDHGTIKIFVKKFRKDLTIQVVDSGVGISEADLSRIFTKFYRVYRGADGPQGNGLGLPIAQSIAKAHNGNIDVQSKPDEGSTFTVILPLA